jgi:hypothetical protein
MSQRVSGRTVTAEGRIRSQVTPYEFVADRMALGELSIRGASVFPGHHHFTSGP